MAPRESADALAERLGFPPAAWLALLARCGVHDPQAWVSAGHQQLSQLAPGPGAESLRWGLWLPLYSRVRQLLACGERVVLGLNGPIGAGKSTLMAALSQWAAAEELPLAVASIDDTYHCWQERQALLAGNPFGAWRGPPGSHDVALLLERLEQWRAGGALVLPRFDKRLRQGQGDRSGEWRGEPQLLVLEGWLLGCRSLPEARLAEATLAPRSDLALRPQELAWLPIWNHHLKSYEPLWDQLTALWVMRPTSWQWPRRWRLQAEARQRRCGRLQAGAAQSGGARALAAVELERLVRACLLSLPPQLYQEPLIHQATLTSETAFPALALAAEALVLLDSRRRCRWSGPTACFSGEGQPDVAAGIQASASASSSATG